MKIFIDGETIPDQSEGAKARIEETIAPPGNISKQESIDKWWVEKAPAQIEEKYRKTSLDGTYGQLFCLGIAIDEEAPIILKGDEPTILTDLGKLLTGAEFEDPFVLIGHNHLKFDMPFIRHRSIINRIKHSLIFKDVRFNNENYFDTMQAWAGFGNFISMDNLCKALGITSPKADGLDGSKVWDFVQAGRGQEVCDYCGRDIEALREVYKHLTFS